METKTINRWIGRMKYYQSKINVLNDLIDDIKELYNI